jgi:hypothetical protein
MDNLAARILDELLGRVPGASRVDTVSVALAVAGVNGNQGPIKGRDMAEAAQYAAAGVARGVSVYRQLHDLADEVPGAAEGPDYVGGIKGASAAGYRRSIGARARLILAEGGF